MMDFILGVVDYSLIHTALVGECNTLNFIQLYLFVGSLLGLSVVQLTLQAKEFATFYVIFIVLFKYIKE